MISLIKRWKQLKRDSITLYWYRVRIAEYERWLSEFSAICQVLENLRGESELEGRPGAVDISVLRARLRRNQLIDTRRSGGHIDRVVNDD